MSSFHFVDCDTHQPISHGTIMGDTFYGGTPIITCDSGYTQTGTATCGTDGDWITDVKCIISEL